MFCFAKTQLIIKTNNRNSKILAKNVKSFAFELASKVTKSSNDCNSDSVQRWRHYAYCQRPSTKKRGLYGSLDAMFNHGLIHLLGNLWTSPKSICDRNSRNYSRSIHWKVCLKLSPTHSVEICNIYCPFVLHILREINAVVTL